MTIHIHRSDEAGWTRLSNEMLRDPHLSLRAKGLLAQLVSHEDGWQLSLKWAERECHDGRQSIASAFKELEAAGYATKERLKDSAGKFRGWDYHVYDYRVQPPVEVSGLTEVGLTEVGDTEVGLAEVGEAHLYEDSSGEDSQEQKNPLEKTTQDLAPAARAKDFIFEELFYLETGKVYTEASAKELTASGRGALNKAAAEIRATGITPADLSAAIMSWPDLFPGAVCTATAVARHLSRMKMASQGVVARGNGHDSVEAVSAKVLASLKKHEEEGTSWVP